MSEWQRVPNLVMPGVAKRGTTTLCDILVSHPAIAGGMEKEVRYLMDAHDDNYLPDNIRVAGRDGWIKRYPDGGRGNFRYWLDASPQYQYQRTAFETIAAMPEAPRLIFIVRRPSRRLFSMYQFARYNMRTLPHITSFAQFVAEIRRPESSPIAGQRMLAHALTDCRYDEMLERWSAIVPDGYVWTTSVEALGADRDGVLADLANWLGIDPGPLIEAQSVRSNPTVNVRSKFLLAKGGKIAKFLPNRGLIRMAKTFARGLLEAPVSADEMAQNADLLAELDQEFAPHVARFNALAARMQDNFRPLPI